MPHFILFFAFQVDGRHPTCNFMLEVERDETECLRRLQEEEGADLSKGQCSTKIQPKNERLPGKNTKCNSSPNIVISSFLFNHTHTTISVVRSS